MYSITSQGGTTDYNIIESVANTLEDIYLLPIGWKAGSTCLCIEDSSKWILGTDKIWHKLNNAGSGGSGTVACNHEDGNEVLY